MPLSREEVAQLIALLDTEDAQQQRQAMEMLSQAGMDALDPLEASLGFVDARVREAIVRILGMMNQPKAIPTLIGFVVNRRGSIEDANGRGLAMQAIMQLLLPKHAPKVFDFLMQAKSDDDPFVRGYAIEALGRLGDLRAQPIIKEAMADPDEFVQERAQVAMGQLASAPAPTEQGQEIDDETILQKIRTEQGGSRTYYINALMAKPNAFELAKRLIQEGGKGALFGLQIMQSTDDERARTVALHHFVGDQDPTERAICLRIMAKHLKGDATADEQQVIRQGLHHADTFVKQAALAAAATSGQPDLAEHAIRQVERGREHEALDAAEALSRGSSEHLKRVLPQMRDALHQTQRRRQGYPTDVHVQTEAHMLRALNNVIAHGPVIGASEVIEQALNSLKDAREHWPILVSALRLLRDALGERTLSEESRWSKQGAHSLAQLLDHPEARVRARVVDLLKRGGPKGFSAMTPKLERLLYDEDVDTATDIIPLLARAQGAQARNLLQDLASSGDEAVAQAAEDALRSMRNDGPTISAKFTKPE